MEISLGAEVPYVIYMATLLDSVVHYYARKIQNFCFSPLVVYGLATLLDLYSFKSF
jgi:hypothetical protein